MTSVVRIQISGSGAFSEPNNGVELYPSDLTLRGTAKLSVIPIPGASSDAVQSAGSETKRETLRAVSIGTWAIAKVQKEAGLDNLVWHSSTTSWQGRPASMSLIMGGTTVETMLVHVMDYSIAPRRGLPRLFDVDVNFVRLP
jgi:hypothetical protein